MTNFLFFLVLEVVMSEDGEEERGKGKVKKKSVKGIGLVGGE